MRRSSASAARKDGLGLVVKRPVASDHARKAIGPYSQGIRSGPYIFVSGQVGIDPAAAEIKDGIQAQTEQALRNVAAILEAAGRSMADLVKTTTWLTNPAHFAIVNEIYARHVPDPAPTRPLGADRGGTTARSAHLD